MNGDWLSPAPSGLRGLEVSPTRASSSSFSDSIDVYNELGSDSSEGRVWRQWGKRWADVGLGPPQSGGRRGRGRGLSHASVLGSSRAAAPARRADGL